MSQTDAAAGEGLNGVREQVAEAISGLFKDNRNLTSQVSNTSMQLENQIKRIEAVVRRSESVLAQMTIAMSKLGSMSFTGGGGGAGPRRYAAGSAGGSEQNSVLLEIFKENLRLRGIEIDEKPAGEASVELAAAAQLEIEGSEPRRVRPEQPVLASVASSEPPTNNPDEPTPQPVQAEVTPMKQWTSGL